MERQLIVCENDTRPTDPKAVQRRKLIMSVIAACSKGITGKELVSFIFPGFGSERPVVY